MRLLTPKYIESLVEKMLCGSISPEEQGILERWFNQDMEDEVIWNSDDTDKSGLQKRLIARIKKNAGISNSPRKVKTLLSQPRCRYYTLAAALLILIVSASFFYFFKHGLITDRKSVTAVHKVTPDIAPGHSGAILSLANGNNILINRSQNGKIAQQGNRSIVNKNGQLIYEKMEQKRKATSKNKTASDSRIMYNTLKTPRGREFQIVLSDGSKVWLNAASSITYPITFAGKERKVTVTGEAYFEIAKDSRHPFIVAAGKGEITVLGTHFDVMAYPDDHKVKVTLLEGAVKVSKGEHHHILKPGQQAGFSPQADHIEVTTVDTSQCVAWVKGKLSLNDLGVKAIMQKVSRWYDVDVEFKGRVPPGCFWGVINRNINLSDMLSAMRANGIEANLKGRQIVVSSK